MTYLVRYEMEIDAESADEAAREFYDSMRDPESYPPMLEVVPAHMASRVPETAAVCIDLYELGLDERGIPTY